MKIQFDSKQQFQIDAINAIVDVFDGQPLHGDGFEISFQTRGSGLFGSQLGTELGVGNALLLSDEAVLKNVRAIQDRNDIDNVEALQGYNFSVEMETGTGKTYVYLRTIFELSQKYGFKKYIIVVPSVAIREGVLKNLQITNDHFKVLYNNVPFEYFVYDARKVNRLRQFAASSQIQILIINIDAFRKNFTGTEDEVKSNVIYKESDKLSGRQPIEFVSSTRPIVIIDEPQSVDNTEKSQEAIKALNPLCTLRYSATHRNVYNLMYKLDPIRAFDLRLVKQIKVGSVREANAFNEPFVRLDEVDNRKGISAKVTIHVATNEGVMEKRVKVKTKANLFNLSNEREVYSDGYVVTEINAEPDNSYIVFSNGRRLSIGEEQGGLRDDLMRLQVRKTVQSHLEKEIQLKGTGVKVLSLFFIDKVANYRSYDAEGRPSKGKFATWFEEFFGEFSAQERYKEVIPFPVEKVHDGYFAQDKKGVLKDTSGVTQADESVYDKIMRNKEQLLSPDEPLRFIFSHSALREGWDNPNVFQICTLNETRSVMRKRQEIGRGLRLPVNKDGVRVFDDTINKLLIIANESYEDFARALQSEYEEDCGVIFGRISRASFSQIARMVGGEEVRLGKEASSKIYDILKDGGFITGEGRIQPKFNPSAANFDLALGAELDDVKSDVISVLNSLQLSSHIKNEADERKLVLNKGVYLDEGFKLLWDKIKAKTTYSVTYSTDTLIANAVKGISRMEAVEPIKLSYREAQLSVERKGVEAIGLRDQTVDVVYVGGIPDVIAYLQKETELTRSTIVSILKQCGRLSEFLVNPQRFMEAVSSILKRELNRLIIDGIKYERVSNQEYEMRLFEEREIVSYLNNRLEVKKSIYDAVVFDSDVERKFAEDLERREDIKLFVKLPRWFKIETPIGEYNPDWAILKHDDTVLYLVRETKGTRDFERMRNAEADKVRCGRRHFEELKVDFDVVTKSSEV
jgi:type III restriction enzyme